MSQEIEIRRELDAEQVALIQRTLVPKATIDELQLFIEQCNRTQLDPFARQIYGVMRYNAQASREVMQTQVSIDGARLVAQRSGEYAGQTAVYYANEQGEWTDLWLDSMGLPAAAKVGVYRRGFVEPMWATATWNQYAVTKKDGTPNAMWSKMPALMLGKCAEMLALRKAFPMELSGLYSTEEMMQADAPERADDQSTTTRKPAAKTQGKPAATSATIRREAPTQRDIASPEEHASLGSLLSQLNENESAEIITRWKAADLPPFKQGLLQTEIQTAMALVMDYLNEDVIDAEIAIDVVQSAQAALREGEEPFTYDDAPSTPQKAQTTSQSASASSGSKPTTEITKPQIGKIRAMCSEQGVDPHEYASQVLDESVDSLSTLTKAQAHKIIDRLVSDGDN